MHFFLFLCSEEGTWMGAVRSKSDGQLRWPLSGQGVSEGLWFKSSGHTEPSNGPGERCSSVYHFGGVVALHDQECWQAYPVTCVIPIAKQ